MDAEEPKKVIVPKKAADIQRYKVEKLMKNPEKPVFIPEKKEEREPRVFRPPEFIRNIWGSSAGVGSGDFHIYRNMRRRQNAREKYMDYKSEKEKLDAEYHHKIEENAENAEVKTAKKRAKRLKKKQKQKVKKLKSENKDKPESSDSNEEDNEDEDEDPIENQDSNVDVQSKDNSESNRTSNSTTNSSSDKNIEGSEQLQCDADNDSSSNPCTKENVCNENKESNSSNVGEKEQET